MSSSDAWHALARAQAAVADYRMADARHAVQEARAFASTVTDPAESQRLRARLAFTESVVVLDADGMVAALTIIDGVLNELEQGPLDHADLTALGHMQAGSLLFRSGDCTGALARFAAAEAGRAHLTPADQMRLLLNRGTASSLALRLDDGARDLAAASELAWELGDQLAVFIALHNLGMLHAHRGDLPAALQRLSEAESLPVEIDRGVAYQDKASVLRQAGLLDEARAALGEAERRLLATGNGHEVAVVQLERARVRLCAGDPAAAQDAREARRSFAGRDAHALARAAACVEWEALLSGRPTSAATQAIARLADVVREQARDNGEVVTARTAALIATHAWVSVGDLNRAVASFAAARGSSRSPLVSSRLAARFAAARLALAQGERSRAARLTRAGAADLSEAQRRTSGLDARTAVSVHASRLAALDLGLALDTGRPSTMLAAIERWRTVEQIVVPVQPEAAPQDRTDLDELRSLHARLRVTFGPEVTELLTRASRLEERVRARQWQAGTLTDTLLSRSAVTPALLARTADERGATFVAFAAVRRRLHAVVISPRGRRRLVDVAPLDAVAEAIRRLVSDASAVAQARAGTPIAGLVQSSLDRSSGTLDRLLLDPLVEAGARLDGSLVVLPTHTVSAVPWGLLPRLRGVPVTVTRSAAMWCHDATKAIVSRVVAVAGPELAQADAEVAGVAAAWGEAGIAVSSGDATRDDFVTALTSADVVHVAAHGRHERQSPLFSSVRLSDGVTFAHEFTTAGVRARHVVLSACDTGRATLRPGDEPLGLTAALMSAGATCVVSPVTVVPDEVAREVMVAYHDRLGSGEDAATALATASAATDSIAGVFTCFGAPWRAEPGQTPRATGGHRRAPAPSLANSS